MTADPVAEACAELERIHAAIVAASEGMAAATSDTARFELARKAADDLEGAVALGEVDADAAARERAAAVTGQERATVEYQRHRAALQALRARVPAAERAIVEARFADVVARLEPAGDACRELSGKYAEAVAALVAAGDDLAAVRIYIDEVEAEAASLAKELGVEAPRAVDEIEWPIDDLPAAVKLLSGGARTPTADREGHEAENVRKRQERDVQDVRRVAHELAQGNESALSQIDERLHDEAWRVARVLYDEANLRMIAEDTRNREATGKLIGGEVNTTPMAEQLATNEQRLINEVAVWLAEHGISEDAPALRKLVPWHRPEAIEKARDLRRQRLADFERRNQEYAEREATEVVS